MLYCNGNFIGGLFDEELCFVYADSVSELLGQPEPIYRGYSSTAQHRMLVIPEKHLSLIHICIYWPLGDPPGNGCRHM